MTITYSAFFGPTVLGTSATNLGTAVPSSPTSILVRGGRMRLTNTTASPVSVTLYAVPNAGSPGPTNAFVSAKSVGANDYLDTDIPILPAGATLEGLASAANSITAHMLNGGYYS